MGRNLHDHPNIMNEYELVEEAGLMRHLRMDRATLAAGGGCRRNRSVRLPGFERQRLRPQHCRSGAARMSS